MGERITERERREDIALSLLDAYRWTDPAEVGDGEPFERGLRMLALDDPINEAQEEDLLKSLLQNGWNLVPAADQLPASLSDRSEPGEGLEE